MDTLSSNVNARWIWESLRDDYAAIAIDYDHLNLEALIDPSENIWILLDETVNEQTKFWIYEGSISAFNKILWESAWMDEVLIVSKKYEWILILNHHDMMIGTGKMKN